jgi:hypothetical protein
MRHGILMPPLLFVLVIIAGCSRAIDRSQLYGRYAVIIGDQRQVVQLNANNTYDNLFYQRDTLIWRRSGRWSYGYDNVPGKKVVTFARFQFGLSDYASLPVGFWPVEPERTVLGLVKLCFDPDLNDRCFVHEK